MSQKASSDVQGLLADALPYHQAGRLADAERLYKQITVIEPHHADALHLLGVIAHQVGRNDAAVELIGKAIKINWNAAVYRSNLGSALRDLGRIDDAVASYDAALRIKPDYAEAHSNRGNALQDLGCIDAAVASYNAALRIKPDYAEAHYNLGNALQDLGRFDAAVASYIAALHIRPDLADAHSNLGKALQDLGQLDDAVASCRAALCIKPDLAEAHSNLGNALRDLGRPDAAVASYGAALRIKPDLAEAHFNLGIALADLGRPGDAAASFGAALRIKPDYADAHSNLLMVLHYQPGIGRDAIMGIARRFAAQVEGKFTPAFSCSIDPDRRLRIGYVSGDFGRHPVGYFLSRVLASHDRRAVEVFCYSNSRTADDMTLQLRRTADHWRSVLGLSDDAAAALVAADFIDILVDLAGHTAKNRLALFARKPAPVQVTWLGYFGTTGLTAMDYILADRFVAPEDDAADYTESIWRLPDSYLCFSSPDMECPLFAPPVTRGEPITFGSFNNYAKTSSTTVALWSRILFRVPGSRLLLKTKALAQAKVRERLLDQFLANGIKANRLLLEGASPRGELLSSYNRVDVALDPTPYGGGTTTAEALWMGVPVVTLRGETWVGRVSESILSTVGLRELVATSPNEYAEIAVGLATDRRRLTALRSGLRARVEASTFCDGGRFTRNLEHAYRGMWKAWCATRATNGR